MSKNTEASTNFLEKQIGQLSRQMAAQASSSEGFVWNTDDNLKNKSFKAIELINRGGPSIPKVSDVRKEKSDDEKKSEKEVVVEKEVEKIRERKS